jgi:hypothetical protein
MTELVYSIDHYLSDSLPAMAHPLRMAAVFLLSILAGATYPALVTGVTIL